MIRKATREDDEGIWNALEAVFRAGDTYTVPRDISREDALSYWHAPGHSVFVCEELGRILGTYFLQANQRGGGSHVANCGYVTAPNASGKGVARSMCAHSLDQACGAGFKAMQFNFVVATNERAVRLWQSFDFAIVGRLPEAFLHPALGYVDALVMFRRL